MIHRHKEGWSVTIGATCECGYWAKSGKEWREHLSLNEREDDEEADAD